MENYVWHKYSLYKQKTNPDAKDGWFERYVDWRKVPFEHASAHQMNGYLRALKKAGYKRIYPEDGYLTICKYSKLYHSWFIVLHKNYYSLYWIEDDGMSCLCPRKVTTFAGHPSEDNGMIASKCFFRVDQMFRNIYNIDLTDAFVGGAEDKERFQKPERLRIKSCIPSVAEWLNPAFTDKYLNSLWKADMSSAYPGEACKDLPTLEGALWKKGWKEPTKDYPYAFYLNSHHMAIYNEGGTQDLLLKYPVQYPNRWIKAENRFHFENVPKSQEETILCKTCKYSLKPIYEPLYRFRNVSEENKDVMNISIGYFQGNVRPVAPHINAVIIYRTIRRAFGFMDLLKRQQPDAAIVQIATDAVTWIGGPAKGLYYSREEKDLGRFVLEHSDAEGIFCGTKKYQILDPDGSLTTKWAGVEKEKTQLLNYGAILDPPVECMEQLVTWVDGDEYFHRAKVQYENGRETVVPLEELA